MSPPVDVYKRQGLVQGVIGNALSGGGADYRHAAHVLPNRVKPVSYTHLDVYKRQRTG